MLALADKTPKEMEQSIISIRDKHYINDHLEKLKQSRANAKTATEVYKTCNRIYKLSNKGRKSSFRGFVPYF